MSPINVGMSICPEIMKGRANRIAVSREWDEMIGRRDKRERERERERGRRIFWNTDKNILRQDCEIGEELRVLRTAWRKLRARRASYVSSSFPIVCAMIPKLLARVPPSNNRALQTLVSYLDDIPRRKVAIGASLIGHQRSQRWVWSSKWN